MGACASAPKANKGDKSVAPPPEQLKEERPVTEDVAVATEGGDDKKEEKAVVTEEIDQAQSLGTLLVEGEAPKEKAVVESTDEALPVTEPTSPAEENSTVAATTKPSVAA